MEATLQKTHKLLNRPRRLRRSEKLRDLVRENQLTVNDVVYPLIIRHGENQNNHINSMPGVFQFSVDQLDNEIKEIVELKIPAILLFGIPETKDELGTDSYHDHGIIQKAIKKIRELAPDLLIITDVCFCEYTSHGHCGVMNEDTGKMDLDNDATLELLTKQAVSHAKAGADVVAPSGMVDGMVGAIRHALDDAGFKHIPILSYTVKYASSFYGPFRDAAEGAPAFGDRRTHQMDPGNGQEALREANLDVAEGADMLMVKPASAYSDVM